MIYVTPVKSSQSKLRHTTYDVTKFTSNQIGKRFPNEYEIDY